jgi:hypothetical protein
VTVVAPKAGVGDVDDRYVKMKDADVKGQIERCMKPLPR